MRFFFQGMPRLFSLVFIIPLVILSFSSVSAQESQPFEKALRLYQSGDYTKSAVLFDKVHSNKGLLFAGKSYYQLNDYTTAKSRLITVQERSNGQLFAEASYTLSLLWLKQKKFKEALVTLADLKGRNLYSQLSIDSEKLYNDILSYLTFKQRLEVMKDVENDALLYDITRSAFGRVDFDEAKILFTKMKKTVEDISSSDIDKLESKIEDSSSYSALKDQTKFKAPAGLTYNIGIALPTYSIGKNEYRVAQGLYLGYMLAAEQFNKKNSTKVNLRFQNTGVESDSAQQALENFAGHEADAVIGPLFSEQAYTMADVAEQYKIPIIAPLANAESLAKEGGYIYQVNPTFKVHGKIMANFAKKSLGINKSAIIAEQNSKGALSAKAYRTETQQLGGSVPNTFIEKMGPRGYNLSKYVRYLTEKKDTSAVSAVYAPFTGEQSLTLIDLLLRQLNSLESDITVFGSPEWGNANIPSDKIGDRSIYFTENFYTKPSNYDIDRFKAAFRKRFNKAPNRFALIGYDTATFLLRAIDQVVNPARLQKKLSTQPLYEGLITNINFKGSNINQELMVFKITSGGTYLVSQ